MKHLTELAIEVNNGNAQKGLWDDFEKVRVYDTAEKSEFSGAVKTAFINQFLMLITSEASEACEALRKDNRATTKGRLIVEKYGMETPEGKKAFEAHVKDTFEDELADTLIRILDLAGGLQIDIGWHVRNKLMYNAQREAKHGKKF
jgi:NTP pyrophosphatase (non-canonical NTP hydrolase)